MPEKIHTEADITSVDAVTAIRARPTIYVGDTQSADTLCSVVLSTLGLALDAFTESPAKHVEQTMSSTCETTARDFRSRWSMRS